MNMLKNSIKINSLFMSFNRSSLSFKKNFSGC